MNETQRKLDEFIVDQDNRKTSILKARQEGVSTWVMIYFLMECLSKHATCVMLAHDKDHTEKLLQRVRLMLVNINGPKPKTGKLNDNEISFLKHQSSFYVGTAGNVNFGRSATITHLHCSEIAFWRDPQTLLTGLLQAVPHKTGTIIQETTANGWGTWFQKQYYKYRAGGAFKALFFPWFAHREYFSDTPLLEAKSDYEIWLQTEFNLTDQHLQWRREKVSELENESLFKQEYPATVEEAFRLSGGSLFSNITLENSNDWIQQDEHIGLLRTHPMEGKHYVFGCDAAGGTGNDFSSIVGLCLEDQCQVFTYAHNKISPPDFADVIALYGKQYNTAYLVPESNSHGLSVLAILKNTYPKTYLYRSHIFKTLPNTSIQVPSYGYGWKTTMTTKPYMVGVAQRFVNEGWKTYCPLTYDQLLSFTETEEGRLEGAGDHDDTAVSFMLACLGAMKVMRKLAMGGTVLDFEEKKVEIQEKKSKAWRDEQGRYLLTFEETFKKKHHRLG